MPASRAGGPAARSAPPERAPITAPIDWKDISDQRDWQDRVEPMLITDPIENIDAAEPMLPMDATDPTLPMDRADPCEATDSTESVDQRDHRDARLPMETVCGVVASADRPEPQPPLRSDDGGTHPCAAFPQLPVGRHGEHRRALEPGVLHLHHDLIVARASSGDHGDR